MQTSNFRFLRFLTRVVDFPSSFWNRNTKVNFSKIQSKLYVHLLDHFTFIFYFPSIDLIEAPPPSKGSRASVNKNKRVHNGRGGKREWEYIERDVLTWRWRASLSQSWRQPREARPSARDVRRWGRGAAGPRGYRWRRRASAGESFGKRELRLSRVRWRRWRRWPVRTCDCWPCCPCARAVGPTVCRPIRHRPYRRLPRRPGSRSASASPLPGLCARAPSYFCNSTEHRDSGFISIK